MKKQFVILSLMVFCVFALSAENIISLGLGVNKSESDNITFNYVSGSTNIDYTHQSGIGGSFFLGYDYSFNFGYGVGAHIGASADFGIMKDDVRNYSNLLRYPSILLAVDPDYFNKTQNLYRIDRVGANLNCDLSLRIGITYSKRFLSQFSYIPICFSLNELVLPYYTSSYYSVLPFFTTTYQNTTIYNTNFSNLKWGFSYSFQFGKKLNRNGFILNVLVPYESAKSTVIYMDKIECYNIVSGWEVFLGYRTSFVF